MTVSLPKVLLLIAVSAVATVEIAELIYAGDQVAFLVIGKIGVSAAVIRVEISDHAIGAIPFQAT